MKSDQTIVFVQWCVQYAEYWLKFRPKQRSLLPTIGKARVEVHTGLTGFNCAAMTENFIPLESVRGLLEHGIRIRRPT